MRSPAGPVGDHEFVANTLPDPFADSTLPWWRRRLTELYHGRRRTPPRCSGNCRRGQARLARWPGHGRAS